jgi:cyclopropane fatty-acyl-phospholipid synthase-like methyltransferase
MHDPLARDKPFSPSCERNRDPILAVLRDAYADRHAVLEIGSGSGQHAVHFAAAMPWLSWQCSDVGDNLPGIRAWLDDAALPNTPPPLQLDLALPQRTARRFDALFSANTLHIIGWPLVEALFARLSDWLQPSATVVVYGPFNYAGTFTSDSNREFDGWLKARDPRSGIREFEAVDTLARTAGLVLVDDRAMPANNRCLTWRRR